VAVGNFSLQGTRHYLGILLGRHFITDDFDSFVDELRPAFKNSSHYSTDVLYAYSAKARIAEWEGEAVAPIWLALRREVIQEILKVKGNVNKRKWHVP
jgi:hypothetical protein